MEESELPGRRGSHDPVTGLAAAVFRRGGVSGGQASMLQFCRQFNRELDGTAFALHGRAHAVCAGGESCLSVTG